MKMGRRAIHQIVVTTLMLLMLLCLAKAAYFYVDAVNGDDARTEVQAQNINTPWRTLQQATSRMAPGDTAYVRNGTYRETVYPQNGQRFEAYQGEKPLITGCDPVTRWMVHSGSVYKATVSIKVLDVFVGQEYMQKARYPDEDGDPLTATEWANTTNSLVSGSGTGKVMFHDGMNKAQDCWVGGWYSGVNGKNPFMAAEGRIVASSGSEITCSDLSPRWTGTYGKDIGEGRGYITDHLNCLTKEQEWHWQDGTLYFWAPGSGMPKKVQARTRIYGFVLSDRSNVTLKGLYFLGASVQIIGGSGNTIDDCHFRHVSPWGTHYYTDARQYYWGGTVDGTTGIHLAGANHTIQNSSVVGGWGHGIHLAGGNNLTISNNYIADFGWNGRFVASPISGFGAGLHIRNNTIRRSSGPGIFLYQKNPGDGANVNHVKQPYILHNDIRDCGYLLDDSGNAFIYIQNADVPSDERALNGEIAYNVLIRQFGGQRKHMTGGIYLDNGTDFCSIHHNVIDIEHGNAAIFLHGAQHRQENIFCYHNTCWGYENNAIVAHTWGKGAIANVIFRNNHAQKDGFRATALGSVISDHNRANVPTEDFVDVTDGNFRLKNGSASINIGVIIAGISDMGGASPYSGSAPDLGAYEYGGTDWVAGSTITAPPAFPSE